LFLALVASGKWELQRDVFLLDARVCVSGGMRKDDCGCKIDVDVDSRQRKSALKDEKLEKEQVTITILAIPFSTVQQHR
jgi:hypothetical protein